MCGRVGEVAVGGEPAIGGGDLVAVGPWLLAKIHSSLLSSCFQGFSWGAEIGEFLPGTNLEGRMGC